MKICVGSNWSSWVYSIKTKNIIWGWNQNLEEICCYSCWFGKVGSSSWTYYFFQQGAVLYHCSAAKTLSAGNICIGKVSSIVSLCFTSSGQDWTFQPAISTVPRCLFDVCNTGSAGMYRTSGYTSVVFPIVSQRDSLHRFLQFTS